MRTWIKKTLWRTGVGFLRMAGLRIPEVSYKNQLIPVEIDAKFNFPVGGDPEEAKRKLRTAENSILNKFRPYIHVEHTAKETHLEVRMKLIIQRYERKEK